jgi:hypothetical protein
LAQTLGPHIRGHCEQEAMLSIFGLSIGLKKEQFTLHRVFLEPEKLGGEFQGGSKEKKGFINKKIGGLL